MKKVEIIAEIAQGYEGKIEYLHQLTDSAIRSGADSIKFQLVYADELATPDYEHYNLFKSLEMDKKFWKEVSIKIKKHKMKLYFDIFGLNSLQNAIEFNADGVKLSTTEFYNEELVKMSLKSFENVIISIGGIEFKDINTLTKKIPDKYIKKVTLFYGLQAEPTALEQNNLFKLKKLIETFPKFNFGFMDHCDGDEEEALILSIMPLSYGITKLEKHFTLDRSLKIEDYISGLDEFHFKKFIELIRKYELALGSQSLELTDAEREYSNKALKVVVASKNLNKNDIISKDDVSLKRIGDSYNSNQYRDLKKVIDKKLLNDVIINRPILDKDI